LIIINFKFSFNANQFVQSNILPDNWIAYIPNYEIIRTGNVRGMDLALSLEEIHKRIKFRNKPIKIKSITRLKFRDKNNNNELKDSSSIKIEFLSNLLPEFISIWSVRSKVRPFINRVRKCYNCLKWRGTPLLFAGNPQSVLDVGNHVIWIHGRTKISYDQIIIKAILLLMVAALFCKNTK